MSVPETAMDEDDETVSRKYDVRAPGKVFAVKAKPRA